MQRKVATTPKKTDEDRARDRERQRRKNEQNAYNRELIKAAGLADDAPAVKAKSATQIINEAKLEIQRKVMDLHAAGIDVDDIAIGLDLTIAKVKKLLDQGLAQLARGHARTNPSENFARYAYFHTRIIQRLDDMIDQFMADPDSKQYNATVTALRAQSDMLDKIYAKGKARRRHVGRAAACFPGQGKRIARICDRRTVNLGHAEDPHCSGQAGSEKQKEGR
jgi:hypothetical protein